MAQSVTDRANRVAIAVDKTADNSLPIGSPAHLLVDKDNGQLLTSGSGGGGSTDMTATNALLTTIAADAALLDTAVGTTSDTTATTDSGTFSLIALFKRSLATLTTIAGNFATLATASNQTNGNQKAQIVNGGNVLAVNSDGSLTCASNLGPAMTYTATGAIALNTTPISSTDVSAYRTVSVQLSALGTSGSLVAELSNDNTNWNIAYIQNSVSSLNGIVSSLNAVAIWNISTQGARYFRLRFSVAQTSGTTTLTAYASQQVQPPLIQQVIIGATANVQPSLNINAGFVSFHTLVASATTNATSVKASNGVVGAIYLTNNSAAVKYVKFFNLGTAPTVGTSTPIIQYSLQPNSSIDVGCGFIGLHFTTGIAYCITGGSALLDSTAVAAGDVLVNIAYS